MRELPYRYLHQDHFHDPLQIKIDRHFLKEHFGLHWHEYYQLTFVIQGTGVCSINGTKQRLAPGAAFLLTPADFHDITPDASCEMELYNLAFPHSRIPTELLDLMFKRDEKIQRHALFEDDKEFNVFLSRIENLEREAKEKFVARDIAAQNELSNILIQWHRKRASLLQMKAEDDNDGAHNHPGIQRALSHIQMHFREPLTLNQIASVAHLSVNYFSELFRKSVGMTFQKYLQLQRLQFAMSTLKSSGSSITEISYAAGFNTLTHFERSFRQQFGITPSEVQKNSIAWRKAS